jgi:hypothetical protein
VFLTSIQIPSIVSYRNGVVRACGAEAVRDFEEHEESAAYWFKVIVIALYQTLHLSMVKSDTLPKLHVHPASSTSEEFEIPLLPAGITVEQVYADLMNYLMENTQRFFENVTSNGAEIWARLRDNIVIVLATPNGWDIREQATLRKAAIIASLVTEENAGQLLQFVSESEASVHYALAQDPGKWLQKHTVFAVIDCGGSTVDTTVYRCVSTSPLSLNEAGPGDCVQVFQLLIHHTFLVEKIVVLMFLRGRRHLCQSRSREDAESEAEELIVQRPRDHQEYGGWVREGGGC